MRLWRRILTREFQHLPKLTTWSSTAFLFNQWTYSLACLINNQTKLWVDTPDFYRIEVNPHTDRRRIFLTNSNTSLYAKDSSILNDGPDSTNTPLIPDTNLLTFTGPFPHTSHTPFQVSPCGSDILMDDICRSFTWAIDKTDHQHMYETLHDTDLILVSDGGHRHSGTYAWILTTSHEVIIARGEGIITGSLALMSSFRAEATGLLHGLIALNQIIHHLSNTNPLFHDKPLL